MVTPILSHIDPSPAQGAEEEEDDEDPPRLLRLCTTVVDSATQGRDLLDRHVLTANIVSRQAVREVMAAARQPLNPGLRGNRIAPRTMERARCGNLPPPPPASELE